MKRIFLLIAAFVLLTGFSLQVDPVTTYVDNSMIEPAMLPVMYDAWQGSTRIANGSTATVWPLADNTFGLTATYTVRARLKDGRMSDNAVVSLVSPLDQRSPKVPVAPSLRIIP